MIYLQTIQDGSYIKMRVLKNQNIKVLNVNCDKAIRYKYTTGTIFECEECNFTKGNVFHRANKIVRGSDNTQLLYAEGSLCSLLHVEQHSPVYEPDTDSLMELI